MGYSPYIVCGAIFLTLGAIGFLACCFFLFYRKRFITTNGLLIIVVSLLSLAFGLFIGGIVQLSLGSEYSGLVQQFNGTNSNLIVVGAYLFVTGVCGIISLVTVYYFRRFFIPFVLKVGIIVALIIFSAFAAVGLVLLIVGSQWNNIQGVNYITKQFFVPSHSIVTLTSMQQVPKLVDPLSVDQALYTVHVFDVSSNQTSSFNPYLGASVINFDTVKVEMTLSSSNRMVLTFTNSNGCDAAVVSRNNYLNFNSAIASA